MKESRRAAIRKPKRRRAFGAGLVDAVVAAGGISALCAITMIPFTSCAKLHGTIMTEMWASDGIQTTFERLASDVHRALAIGDVYGNIDTDETTSLTGTWNPTLITNSAGFPSTNDPLYGNGQQPATGWPPNCPTNGDDPYRWVSDNQTLVIQVPVTDSNGFATNVPQAPGSAPDTVQPNVETHIYTVQPDEQNAGQFVLRLSKIPGAAVPGYEPSNACGTTTLLTGIVGPLNTAGQPKIFQFVDKTDPTGTAQDSINPEKISNYNDVVVNLELMRKQSNGRCSRLGFKTEFFLRNTGV